MCFMLDNSDQDTDPVISDATKHCQLKQLIVSHSDRVGYWLLEKGKIVYL